MTFLNDMSQQYLFKNCAIIKDSYLKKILFILCCPLAGQAELLELKKAVPSDAKLNSDVWDDVWGNV
jgi:hypothetical protein